MSARLSRSPTKKRAAGEMLVHQPERRLARLALARQQRALQLAQPRLADEGEPEAQGRDVGLVIILLEEHPAQHVGAVEAVVGDQRRAVGEIEAGGVALRDEAVADLEHRDAAVRIDVGEEFAASGSRPS